MAPLVVQLVAWAALWLAGLTGLLPAADTPVGALRFALAVMFGFTALSHFLPRTRPDLVRMVPPVFPAPGFLVSVTGVLELAGAIGLVLPPLTRPAALALAALLIALFPANIRAARAGLPVAGRPAMPLRLRLPLQLFWIACLLWVAATHPPAELSRADATRRGGAADERAGVGIRHPRASRSSRSAGAPRRLATEPRRSIATPCAARQGRIGGACSGSSTGMPGDGEFGGRSTVRTGGPGS